MKTIRRRDFLGAAALAGTAAVVSRGKAAALALRGQSLTRTARAADSRVEVLLNEEIGKISPEIYSHFVEHLGGVVYDGIWVGEDSKVPNLGGIRKELVERMRRIKPGVVRWPGGCFADSYNWRDGIGPRSSRPRRTNFWRDDRGRRASEAYAKLDSGPRSMSRTGSAPTSSCASASLQARGPTLRPTCAACRPRISTSGSSTAMRPPGQPHSQTCEPLPETGIRFAFSSGESATSHGVAAAGLRRRSTRR